MSEKVRPIDLATRWGVKKQYINTLIVQGMPIDSIESAEAWYNARRAGGGSSTSANIRADKDFYETVERQRELKALAYAQYLDDLRNNNPEASKSYSTYDKLVKTLIALEKELQAREIASKEYIKTQTAIERFGRVFAQVREEMTQLGSKIAYKVNPDDPGKAMKVIEEEVRKILERVSMSAQYAEQAIVKETESEPDDVIETNETAIDETIDEIDDN